MGAGVEALGRSGGAVQTLGDAEPVHAGQQPSVSTVQSFKKVKPALLSAARILNRFYFLTWTPWAYWRSLWASQITVFSASSQVYWIKKEVNDFGIEPSKYLLKESVIQHSVRFFMKFKKKV